MNVLLEKSRIATGRLTRGRIVQSTALSGCDISAERVSTLIGGLYAGLLDEARWADWLAELRGAVLADQAVLRLRCGMSEELGMVLSCAAPDMPSAECIGTDRLGLPEGVAVVRAVSGASVLAAELRMTDGVECRLRFFRQAGADFGPSEEMLLSMLLPHLREAVRMRARLAQVECERKLWSATMDRLAIGALILDERGQVLRVTPMADSLLAGKDGLFVAGGRLHASFPAEDRDLQTLVGETLLRCSATTRPRAMAISRPSGARGLGVLIQPIAPDHAHAAPHRASAVLFIRDPDALGSIGSGISHEMMRQLFDLTPAESAVALRLAGGQSLEEAAADLAISRNTARAHLRSIFSKTGITRQTELVRMLLNSVASLGCATPGGEA